MSKSRWFGRQFSRFDLTVTKLSKVIALIGYASMIVTSIVLGGSLLLFVVLVCGFGLLMLVAYVLDKSGFQKDSFLELFDQQSKELWWLQQQLNALLIAEAIDLPKEERKDSIHELKRRLQIS